jgi:hypothetical protein
MSDTIRSHNTSGLTPKKQIQVWSDTLTDLCGHFDIDPLEASSFEGRINYTTVSKLSSARSRRASIGWRIPPRAPNSAAIRSSRSCFRLSEFRTSNRVAATSI